MTILTTVLIAAPIAFMAGWILAKALLRSGGPSAGKRDYQKLLQQQQRALTERDGQIAELHAELDKAAASMLQSKQKFRSWRERIRPIAKQFRQQRAIITELRDELRRRDSEQQSATKRSKPAAAKTKRAATESTS